MKIDHLRAKLPESVDGALLFSEANRRYFTDFPSSNGALLLSRTDCVFLTDSRYTEAAQKQITFAETVDMEQMEQEMSRLGLVNIALEARYVTLAHLKTLQEAHPDKQFFYDESLDIAVEALRMCKTPEELASICAAQRIAEAALERVLGLLKPGVTERELALELDFYMLKHGAEAISFDTIVLAGPNGSMPHGVPSDYKIQAGDFVTMDFGAVVDGYHSDMTRTVAIGSVSEEQRRVYDIVLEAQKRTLAVLAPGVTGKEADAAGRDHIAACGYGEFLGHGVGHGVGLDIHEEPHLSLKSEHWILAPDHVVTVEPAVYLPGRFGLRIEDMALITEEGHENLTHVPKELLLL